MQKKCHVFKKGQHRKQKEATPRLACAFSFAPLNDIQFSKIENMLIASRELVGDSPMETAIGPKSRSWIVLPHFFLNNRTSPQKPV
jgi:hypothetical protein